ncbi:MAG: nucleotide sugar dehydrogenase [Spirochaetales bacterium]|nr:nucleotide sugar dehydrogenase [Spirochaetales bacterium]
MFKYDICMIGGGGHVGLPLSIAFADKGKNVIIYDSNLSTIDMIGRGEMPFMEKGCEEILPRLINKKLFVSTEISVIRESEFVIIIIGTPVDRYLNPAFPMMKRTLLEFLPYMCNEQVVVLRSTVYPGTSEKINHLLKQDYPGIGVCFACERILEGKALEELFSLPQVIAGFEKQSIDRTADLFRLLTKEIIITGAKEAELLKLFTNSWRYIQFAIANQFYMIAEEYGADFKQIYHAMTHNYPRTQGFPRPGFTAGPCLFKDAMQLSAYSNNQFYLGHSAMLVNEGLPNFIVKQMEHKYDLSSITVGILGMTFKAESDDIRASLSYKLKKILEFKAGRVLCSDPYVQDEEFTSEDELIRLCDVVIIGAPHKKYKDLDYHGKEIIDVWNHLNR